MLFDYVDDQNFMVFAAKAYDNPSCIDILEFNDDLNRIKYIKRLLNKHLEKNDLKERLILNHIIILGNLFGPVPTCRILFFKIEERLQNLVWKYLKDFS